MVTYSENQSFSIGARGQAGPAAGIGERGCVLRVLTTEEDKAKAYRLRHTVFCGELGWLRENETRMEADGYDPDAVHFGVFDVDGGDGRLLAYLRLILSGGRFMIEKEFSRLVGPWHRIRKTPDTAEISRLCVAPGARNERVEGNFGIHHVSVLLFKGVYEWCMGNGVRYLYAVAEPKVYRLFIARGFPYRLVGEPATMPDGVIAGAVLLDWREFESVNASRRPDMLRWFSRPLSAPAQAPQLRPEACLPSPVSA